MRLTLTEISLPHHIVQQVKNTETEFGKPLSYAFARINQIGAWFFILAILYVLLPENTLSSQEHLPLTQNSAEYLPTGFARNYFNLAGEWSFKELNDEEWQTTRIPSLLSKEGNFFFRRHFTLDSSFINQRFQIIALGIEQTCTIYLNNEFIGNHEGGVQSFIMNVPYKAIFFHQPNELLLEVDTHLSTKTGLPLRLRPHGLPPLNGGLYREIFLVASPHPGINDIHTKYELNETFTSCHLELDVTLNDYQDEKRYRTDTDINGDNYECLAELWQPNQHKPPVTSKIAKIDLTQAPPVPEKIILEIDTVRIWSPDDPFLYSIRLILLRDGEAVDELLFPIGFRRIEIVGGQLNVNDQVMELRTIEWVDDLIVRNLNSDSLIKLIEEDMAKIKELGANCVRVVSGQPHPALIATCDRLGLFVLEEIPAINAPGGILARDDFRSRAEFVLRELIRRDRNHPSVLAWGIGSGFNPKNKATQAFASRMVDMAHQLDSRPIYAGVQGKHILAYFLPVDIEIIKVPVGQIPQFSTRAAETLSNSTAVSQALLVSFSVPIIPYQDFLNDPQRGEDKQAVELKTALDHILKKPWLTGVSIDAWRDWRGDFPHLIFGPRPGANLYIAGIVDEQNNERLSYEMLKAIFNNTSVPKVTMSLIETQDPAIFPLVGIGTLLIFIINFRRDRTFRQYLRRIFTHPHGFYVDRRENRRVNPFYTLLTGMTVIIILSLISSSFFYVLRENIYLAQVISVMFPDPQTAYRFLWLVWHPLWFILFLMICFCIAFFTFSLFLKIVSIFTRSRIRFLQILMSVNWMAANILFALPIAIVFYRAFQLFNMAVFITTVLAILLIWSGIRIFRATQIILILNRIKTWLLYGTTTAVLIFLVGMYLEQTRVFSAYFIYYISLLW